MASADDDALTLLQGWPVPHVAGAVVRPESIVVAGDRERVFRLASLSKPIAAWAIMIGVEEGIVELDTPVAPIAGFTLHPGTTLRHLLAHASGLPFDGTTPVAALERRRIYSNSGIEAAAAIFERAAGMPFRDYLQEGVFDPLEMDETYLSGSPAHGVRAPVGAIARFVDELLRPRLISTPSAIFVATVQYRGLPGIVPGVGKYDPCPWGLGIEIKGAKSPHWMGSANSAATIGHFGGAGTMMWADPVADCGVVALTDRPFEEWSIEAIRSWELFSNVVIDGAPQ